MYLIDNYYNKQGILAPLSSFCSRYTAAGFSLLSMPWNFARTGDQMITAIYRMLYGPGNGDQ